MRVNFKNKLVLITGASAGIGKALAKEIAEKGATIILASRKLDALNAVKSQLVNPESHMVKQLDLASTESIQSLYSDIKQMGLEVDYLINNGGISQRSFALDTVDSVERRLMETNFFGTVTLTKLLLKIWLKRKVVILFVFQVL